MFGRSRGRHRTHKREVEIAKKNAKDEGAKHVRTTVDNAGYTVWAARS